MKTKRKMKSTILIVTVSMGSTVLAFSQNQINDKSVNGIKVDAVSGANSASGDVKQEHDNNKAPHGGKVQEAGAYHIEAVIKDGKAYFYLLDGKAKPMPNKGVTGSVVLQFADGSTKTIQLILNGVDGFLAEDANSINYTNAIVTFKIGDKTATAKFKNKDDAKPHEHKENERHQH